VFVDAGSHAGCLVGRLGAGSAFLAPLIVVASAAELGSPDLAGLEARSVVLKPVERSALREALAAVLAESAGAAGAAPATAAMPAAKPLGAHVLLVEDEAVNAAVAQGYLTALGCTSVWVKDGAEAVARNAAERFDLILMDLSMPVMDGFATTALIRQRGGAAGRVPIVALTAHDAANFRQACLAAGMDEMLSKPYTLEECARAVRRFSARSASPSGSAPTGSAPTGSAPTGSAPRAEPLASVDPSAIAGLRRLRGDGRGDLYSKLVELFEASCAESLAQLA